LDNPSFLDQIIKIKKLQSFFQVLNLSIFLVLISVENLNFGPKIYFEENCFVLPRNSYFLKKTNAKPGISSFYSRERGESR